MTADLAEIIKNFFIEKGIDISKIKFTGLDGPSAKSSNKVSVQVTFTAFFTIFNKSELQKPSINSVLSSHSKTVSRSF